MDLKIKLLPGGKMPHKATPGAACYDLYAREIIEVNPFYYRVKLGVVMDIPEGYKVMLYSRSSITNTGWGVANAVGIIDSDFLGELELRLRPYEVGGVNTKLGNDNGSFAVAPIPIMPFPYKVGDRVAQFSLEEVTPTTIIEVQEIEKRTTRGTGGHGSTGK